jgi:hypothetical protein
MLKLKEGFILREIGGEIMVIPSGDELDLNMMITLNETGRFLWERLEEGTTVDGLVSALLAEYEVEEAVARKSAEAFVEKLNVHNFLI